MTDINRKALHYSGGIGGLMTLANLHKYHTRRHRMCRNLIDGLENKIEDLGTIEKHDIKVGHIVFQMMESQLDGMIQETGLDGESILAALCLFNIEELSPLHPHLRARLDQFIECFPAVLEYPVTRAGERLWQRMETEIEIQQAEEVWTVED